MLLTTPEAQEPRWIKVVDQTRCVGCHACTVACKSENVVPVGVTRTYVKQVESGRYPDTRRHFQITRCNQCYDPPCVAACPVSAMYQRKDGIVDFDKNACIGCKACIAACPYDAIFINPEDGSAEKCNFCTHKLDVGLEPACVTVCPAEALLIGDGNDPNSKVAQHVGRDPVSVRRPEKATKPKLYYLGLDQSVVDPLAAQTPEGNLFQWSENPHDLGHGYVASGMPETWSTNNTAASLLNYDINHKRPWDWRVSLYTWTKSISSGALLFSALALLLGWVPEEHALIQWVAPLVAGVFLALTGVLLIWDLTHPLRFFYIFIRPQWRSWLTRGAFIIAAYGLLVGLWLLASLFAWPIHQVLAWLVIPTATMTAVYTAFLFAQSKARDLWQNPLLPFHMALQALLAGSAVMGLGAALIGPPEFVSVCLWTLASSAGLHALIIWGEIALPSVTAHAHLAEKHLVHGIFRPFFWLGVLVGGALPVALLVLMPTPMGVMLASVAALGGLLAYEHAYVQAGQAVPLA